RQIKTEDARAIVVCLNTSSEVPSNLEFFSKRIPTLNEEKAWIRSTLKRMKAGQEIVFAVETSDEKNFIGTAGLHEIDWKNKNARIGITIFNEKFHGQGYAREIISLLQEQAFNWLCLKKVFMNFRPNNEKMRRIAAVLGYREVGILKSEYFWRGEWLDLVRHELVK
ncbi:MAG: GNAT family protein, partial [Patescibacteria group bacterium]